MSLAVAIQMDPIESIDIDADSTFMLAMEAQARRHALFHYLPEALVFRQNRLYARAQPLEVRREKKITLRLARRSYSILKRSTSS